VNRKERKERTRGRIVEAAFQIMGRDGLFSATTLDIAQAAGVAHGTVFAHFHNRDDLLCAVIEELGLRVAYRLHLLAEAGRSVRDILSAHLAGLAEHEQLYMRLITEGRLLPRAPRMSFVMIQSAISLHLGAAVEAETRAGLVRPMALSLLFNTWVGLVHHYLVNGDLFTDGSPSVLKQHGPALIDQFYFLISVQS
jgi:AcrR family transcriptional regulator